MELERADDVITGQWHAGGVVAGQWRVSDVIGANNELQSAGVDDVVRGRGYVKRLTNSKRGAEIVI